MERRLTLNSMLLCLLLGASIVGLFLPVVRGQACQVQIDRIDFPPKVSFAQTIEVRAQLVITCTTSANIIVARTDLTEQETGTVLSSHEFSIGYITEPQKTVSVDTSNRAQAPIAAGTWRLSLHVSLFAATLLFASAEQSFGIEVSDAVQESLTETSVLQNGGFENGLSGWRTIGRPAGYSTITEQLSHSGSASVKLDLLQTGQVINAPEFQGVLRSVVINDLRDLRIEAWFLMMHSSTAASARLRIEVGGLTLNYYVSYGNRPRLEAFDNASSKSLFVTNIGPNSRDWGTWLFIGRNVRQDMASSFGLDGLAPFQQKGVTPVLITLELVGLGATSDQLMYWDDVKVLASTPVEMTTTTTIEATSTSIITENQTGQTGETTREGKAAVLNLAQNGLPIIVAVAVIILAAAVLLYRARKHRKAGLIRTSTEEPVAVQFCVNCGSPLQATDRYCANCGYSKSR